MFYCIRTEDHKVSDRIERAVDKSLSRGADPERIACTLIFQAYYLLATKTNRPWELFDCKEDAIIYWEEADAAFEMLRTEARMRHPRPVVRCQR
jgi:hypothetical protein